MSEQLTQREVNWIDGWIDALESSDSDPYAVTILWKLVTAARGAHDAEQRAEQAEAELARQREEARQAILAERRVEREAADKARQEAAKLREALQRALSALQEKDDAIDARIDGVGILEEALHSSDAPASEPRDNYGHCPKCEGALQELEIVGCPACDTPRKGLPDHAPVDRPEPSEALLQSELEATRLARDELERLYAKALENSARWQETAERWYGKAIERAGRTQPAPAVPDDYDEAVELMARIIERHEDKPPGPSDPPFDYQPAWIIDTYFRRAKRALSTQPSESPAVPDAYAVVGRGVIKGLWSATDDMDHIKAFAERHGWNIVPMVFAAAPTPTDDGD